MLNTELASSLGVHTVLLQVLKYSAIAVIGALLALCWTYRNRGFWSTSSANKAFISGPEGKFLKGSVQELETKGDASCVAWWSLYERFGPAYEMTIPFFRLHIINHPTYLEHIQKHNSKNYIRGAFTRNVFGALHRTGIFVSDGEQWQFQRKAATRAFSKRNFETHITASMHYWLDILMRLLSRMAEEERSFDFQDLMGRFLLCLFLKVAFHEDKLAARILSDDPRCLEETPAFVKAFDRAQSLFDKRRRNPLWKLTEKLSGENHITKEAVDLFYAEVDGLIQQRIDEKRSGFNKVDQEGGVDLLELFMQTTEDKYTLGGMCFSFLAAGRDTTAYGTSWLMKEIHCSANKHFDPLGRIHAELLQQNIQGFLTYGEAPKLKFLNAMWDESARLNTVSPAGQMEAAEDDVLPAIPELNIPPRYVKKGDIVSYQNYVMSRMPLIWGDDCAVFDPFRWSRENGEGVSYSPFKYHSWNAGPRSCIGRALATYEGLSIAVAIVQRFDVQLLEPDKHFESLPALNMGIRGGLHMIVKKRLAVLEDTNV